MKLRELLTDKSKWTKHTLARNTKGSPVHPLSDEAVCWCLVGAMQKCYSIDSSVAAIVNNDVSVELREAIKRKYGHMYISTVLGFNDTQETTFEQVKEILNEIEKD